MTIGWQLTLLSGFGNVYHCSRHPCEEEPLKERNVIRFILREGATGNPN